MQETCSLAGQAMYVNVALQPRDLRPDSVLVTILSERQNPDALQDKTTNTSKQIKIKESWKDWCSQINSFQTFFKKKIFIHFNFCCRQKCLWWWQVYCLSWKIYFIYKVIRLSVFLVKRDQWNYKPENKHLLNLLFAAKSSFKTAIYFSDIFYKFYKSKK